MNDMHEIGTAPGDQLDALRNRFERMRALTRTGLAPTLAERRDRLDRLRQMLIESQDAFIAAMSQDFGHRSPDESRLLDIVMTLNSLRAGACVAGCATSAVMSI